MTGEFKDYNEFLAKVRPPAPMSDAAIDSEVVAKIRADFFAAVKQAFEPHLSYLALDTATHEDWVASPTQFGVPSTDISSELVLHTSTERPVQVIASAFQTREHSIETVRFMVVPLNKYGNAVLRSLHVPDDAFGDATFRR